MESISVFDKSAIPGKLKAQKLLRCNLYCFSPLFVISPALESNNVVKRAPLLLISPGPPKAKEVAAILLSAFVSRTSTTLPPPARLAVEAETELCVLLIDFEVALAVGPWMVNTDTPPLLALLPLPPFLMLVIFWCLAASIREDPVPADAPPTPRSTTFFFMFTTEVAAVLAEVPSSDC